jgi:hypothetical protein
MPKLYLSKTGSGYTPATIRGTWDKTSDHVVRGMHTVQDLPGLGAPIAVSSVETSATTDYENLLLRGVSAPLAADHNFAGTLNLMLGRAGIGNGCRYGVFHSCVCHARRHR